jgi:hypothetical protein
MLSENDFVIGRPDDMPEITKGCGKKSTILVKLLKEGISFSTDDVIQISLTKNALDRITKYENEVMVQMFKAGYNLSQEKRDISADAKKYIENTFY